MQQYNIPLRRNTILLISQRYAEEKTNKGVARTGMVTGLVFSETSTVEKSLQQYAFPSTRQQNKLCFGKEQEFMVVWKIY